MKKSDKIKKLKTVIKEKEIQLQKLSEHVDKSNICSDLYNKVVMEKAELNKQLQDLQTNKFAQTLKNILPHKKVLICDYFKD
ncbi:hypothetical protein IJ732_04310 [bacterium]|nr:hypothetical protein [bacterium]